MSGDRPRILLVAPPCDGEDVGEARSTFEWVRRIAQRAEVTVLTYHLRKARPGSEQLRDVEVIEWTDLPLVGRWERLNAFVKPGYFMFCARARRWIRNAITSGRRWDLAHQVGPLALRYPSPAVGLVRPFVFGPLAGSIPTPAAFRDELTTDTWYMRFRDVDRWRFRHDPSLRRTYETADVVIGVAPYVRSILSSHGVSVQRFETMSEVGVASLPPQVDRRRHTGGVRLLFVGRVVRTKGVRDAVRAMAHLRDLPDVRLDVVGDGPDRAACEHEARELNIADRVTFHGHQSRDAVDEFYRNADVFVFPSFREPSGNVVVEAMSWGLPLIVAANGGPSAMVTDTCGIRIEPTEPGAFAEAISDAIRSLVRNPVERLSMGEAGRNRIEQLALWERKVDRLFGIYDSVRSTERDDGASGRIVAGAASGVSGIS